MQEDQDGVPPSAGKKKWMTRRRGACEVCKSKKVRCDGATPCRYCTLHDLECEYQPSKKQQTSNKSQTTLAAENGSVEPSHAENDDSGATTLIGVPSDVRMLPELTGTRNGVSGIAGSSTQETMFAADDRHIMPVMFDRFAHDDFSAASMEWICNDNLGEPFSTNMTNMSGLGMLPWSSSQSNYSEANLDVSNVVEHTTSASADLTSASQFEMDLSMSPTGAMRGRYDENMWEEASLQIAMGKPPGTVHVNANHVQVKDHSPRIDFSLTVLFSPEPQRLESLSRTEQDEVYGIFRRLADVQTQMSSGLDGEPYDGSHSSWYWSDTALNEKCKAACFEQPLGISTFLTRSHFDYYVQQAKESPSLEGLAVKPLIDSVMAFGFHTLVARSQTSAGSDVRRKAIARVKMALGSRDAVQRSPDTLLKMQMTISEQIDDKVYTELLSHAVSCARTRTFVGRDSVYMSVAKEKETLARRRCLWYIYSIEVIHSIRNGMPPILTRDWIDYGLPEVGKVTDWLLIQCQHANVLSAAVNTLYSQMALRQNSHEREQNLMQAHKALESWRTGLPMHLQNIHRHEIGYANLDDPQTRHLTLTMVHKYHEAVFIIFFPWTGSQSNGLISEHYRELSRELCVKSAQAVLAIAARISSGDTLDGKLINLIAASICVTFLDIVSGGGKKSLPYLSMCCGIFGSLSLDHELPLSDALKLTQLAQKASLMG